MRKQRMFLVIAGLVFFVFLWSINPLFSEQTPLELDYGMSRPALSPDGQQIAFEWMSSIWIVLVKGGQAAQLTDWSERRSSPVWSPDGQQIACIATDKEVRSFAVQVFNVDRKKMAIEIWRSEREIKPSLDWSSDGENLVLTLDSDKGIHILPAKGGSVQDLKFKGVHPRWSPDGKWLAWQTQDNRELWIASTKDYQKRRLVTTMSFNGSFCWSADSREIVCESLDRGSVDLWKVSVSGGRAVPLTDDIALEQTPRWHPSDGNIYFSHRRRIWRVPAAGGKMELIPIRCQLPSMKKQPKTIAFVGADLVDVKTGQLRSNQTIVVKGDRIEALGANITVPKDVEVVDVKGLTVVPGLIDMHVHYQPWMGPYFLKYGVTRIRECGCGEGPDVILSHGDEIRHGLASGPFLYQCGMIFNGSGVAGPPGLGGVQAVNQEILRKSLEWHIGEGIDFVKIGSENTHESMETILSVAHAHKKRVIGHIALVPVHEAIDMGQDGIEHPRGLGWGSVKLENQPYPVPRRLQGMLREAAAWWNPDPKRVSAIVDHMIEKNVLWDPTLFIWVLTSKPEGLKGEPEFASLPAWIQAAEELGNEYGFISTWTDSDYQAYGAGIENMQKMVGEFHRKGGLLTAGSDGGIPGKSLHQELEQLNLSGLSPLDCLRAATWSAAKALEKESEIGTLEAGKKADLVFLKGDPLKDVMTLRKVVITVQEGRIVYKK